MPERTRQEASRETIETKLSVRGSRVGSHIEAASVRAFVSSTQGQAPRSIEPARRARRPGRSSQHAGPGAQVERASTQGHTPRSSEQARRASRPGRESYQAGPGAQVERASKQGQAPRSSEPARRATRRGRVSRLAGPGAQVERAGAQVERAGRASRLLRPWLARQASEQA